MNRFNLQSHGGYTVGKILPPIDKSKHGDIHILTGDMGIDLDVYIFDGFLKIWKPFRSGSGDSIHGGVFFVDVEPANPADNIGEKNYVDSINVQLSSFTSDSNLVKLKILAITGHSNYLPNIIVEGKTVNLTPLQDKPLFEGWVELDVSGKEFITALHEDGARHTVRCSVEEKPKITFAEFTGDYPSGQTELKQGDTFRLNIKTDKTIAKVEVADYGSSQHKIYTVNGSDVVVNVVIANRGNTPQLLGSRVRVQSPSGSWSNWFETDNTGSIEKKNVVKLNNLHPNINIAAINYPVGQQALKDSESATVVHTINNYDLVAYSSPNGELDIVNVNTFEGNKAVQRISGNYNVTNNNFRIEAKRNANGAVTVVQRVIQIAHVPATITISNQFTRFQSSDVGESYWVRVNSDQKLIEKPLLSIPEGTWNGDFTTTNNTVWTRYVKIYDSDNRGKFNYFGLVAKNLADIETNIVTGSSEYEIGGFKQKQIFFAPFTPIAPLHVSVSDPSKLEVTDVAGYTLNYVSSKTPTTLGFIITDSNGNLAAPFDHVYLLDNGIVTSNSTGNYYVLVQENA